MTQEQENALLGINSVIITLISVYRVAKISHYQIIKNSIKSYQACQREIKISI